MTRALFANVQRTDTDEGCGQRRPLIGCRAGEAVEQQLELGQSRRGKLSSTARPKQGESSVTACYLPRSFFFLSNVGCGWTREMLVNKRIRAGDQDEAPAGPGAKRVHGEFAQKLGPKFAFKTDVKDAHQLVPICPQDSHLPT